MRLRRIPGRMQHAESVSGLSLKTVRKIVHHYLESHELLVEDVSKRGVGAESYPGYTLPEGIQEDVVACVQTELNDDLGPQWVTLQGLQQHILDVFRYPDVSYEHLHTGYDLGSGMG